LRSSIDRLRHYGEQRLRRRDGRPPEANAKGHRLAA
jgi:hypothetical protein